MCERSGASYAAADEIVQVAADAIGLFCEYRDERGYSEQAARQAVLVEVGDYLVARNLIGPTGRQRLGGGWYATS